MAKISLMKYVGGFTRPGYEHALTAAELEALPGYSRDIDKSREDARRLLKEAGVGHLKINFLNRNVGQPYTAAGIYTINQWSKIGIETEHRQLETKLFFDALARGDFDVAIDFITDHGDDPNLQYVHVLSAAMQSPMSYSQHGDTKIDALFERQKRALDSAERKRATREFEQYAIGQAYNIMLFWWQRIVVYNKRVNGWQLTPSHYLGNDLTQVWLGPSSRARDGGSPFAGSDQRPGPSLGNSGRDARSAWRGQIRGVRWGVLPDGPVGVAGLHGLAALGAREMYIVGLGGCHEYAHVLQPFGRQPSLPAAALYSEAVSRFLIGP